MGTQESQNTFVSRSVRNVHILYPRRTFWSSLASRVGAWFSKHDGARAVSGGGQKMKVEPLQHIELDIPSNVHEVILVEDTFFGKCRKWAYTNASTLIFFTVLWFITLSADLVVRFLFQ